MNIKIICGALAAGALFAVPVHAASIVNGSFEDYDTALASTNAGNWFVFDEGIPSWASHSGAGIEVQTNATLDSIDADDGNSYVELDSHNNSSMVQQVYLDVGEYYLNFAYSPRNGTLGDNGIDYNISGGLVDGNISGPSVSPYSAVGEWTDVVTRFSVTYAQEYSLSFEATGTNNSLGGFVDSVSITTVPVPAAGFLLLGALGGLGALRRRRRPVA